MSNSSKLSSKADTSSENYNSLNNVHTNNYHHAFKKKT